MILLCVVPAVCQTPPARPTSKVSRFAAQATFAGRKIDLIGAALTRLCPRNSATSPVFPASKCGGPVGVGVMDNPPQPAEFRSPQRADQDLAQRVGVTFGQDARARGVHFLLGPGVNIYRSPRNGRSFEYFGEDPLSGLTYRSRIHKRTAKPGRQRHDQTLHGE